MYTHHLLSLITLSSLLRAQTINGIPVCAKQCALSIISSSSSCPLTTHPCICAYLSSYSSCVAQNCNATDSSLAVKEPLPYYIPEATISVVSTGTCDAAAATNPVFTSTSTSTLSSTSTERSTSTEWSASDRTARTAGASSTSGGMETSSRGATGTIAASEGPARQTGTNEAKRLEGRGVWGGLGCGLAGLMVWL